MFNKDEFCGKIRACGMTIEQTAHYLGINTRKINGSSDFTRNEMELLRQKFSLNPTEFMAIFFS